MATLDSNVHAGFGLLSLSKGSSLTFDQKLVNNELWLPTSAEIYLVAHAIGFLGFRAQIHMTDDGYKKFHAEAEQQPRRHRDCAWPSITAISDRFNR